MSTDSPSNKPPRILLSSRAPARCDDTGTKLNMLYRVYIKVSQNEIRRTNIFQKQKNYNKIFFTSRICKSAAMGRSRRLVSLNEVRPPVIMCGGGDGVHHNYRFAHRGKHQQSDFPQCAFPPSISIIIKKKKRPILPKYIKKEMPAKLISKK